MDKTTVDLSDFQALIGELQRVPAAMRERVLRGAAATGASVIRKEAILRAPQFTGEVSAGHPPPGTLKRAIYQARLSQECTSTREVFKVGVRRGKKARSFGKTGENRDAFYAFWVEYGHFTRVPHDMTKTAKAAGRALGVAKFVPPQPFMRPAVQAKSQDAIRAAREYVLNQIPLALTATRFLKAA
jgi:HK97 gp10 family phage protein